MDDRCRKKKGTGLWTLVSEDKRLTLFFSSCFFLFFVFCHFWFGIRTRQQQKKKLVPLALGEAVPSDA